MAEQTSFLTVTNITKKFAGVQALKDVSLTINQGEILCLCGENGSGKSTMIKTIAGVYQPTSGTVSVDGRTYKPLRPIDAIQAGIQVIYQDFSLFPNLTVAENIALNQQLAQRRKFVNWGRTYHVAREAMQQVEVDLPLNRRVEQLSVAEKQLTAIARALLQDARLIIMDEPTTALTEREVAALFRVISKLQDRGISILFVSHKLNEVLEIAERVIVFRNGEKVLDSPAEGLTQAQIAYHMTGLKFENARYEFDPTMRGQPLLRVNHLNGDGRFKDISFDLMPGEILGITGLLGSGRTELALALFGLVPAGSGTLEIDGQPVKIRSIQDAIKNRIGYVPEDRLTEGLFLERAIGDNIIVRKITDLLNALGVISRSGKREQVDRWISDLHIKTDDPALPVSSLSGGNQQRVVIAKWLAADPRILILNGPTVGVDVGSKSELHDIIKSLAREGMGILIMSDDIPELMQTCNRILLMRDGQIVQTYQTSDIDEDQLSAALRSVAQTA
jgi:simple sugar transport system ATP-binding protein